MSKNITFLLLFFASTSICLNNLHAASAASATPQETNTVEEMRRDLEIMRGYKAAIQETTDASAAVLRWSHAAQMSQIERRETCPAGCSGNEYATYRAQWNQLHKFAQKTMDEN